MGSEGLLICNSSCDPGTIDYSSKNKDSAGQNAIMTTETNNTSRNGSAAQ
jgi:hypothetical protein